MWRSPIITWALVLGIAMGGFFDGVLLHQILQWHHLLSLVPAAGDLARQVLWDGWFHALMYLLAGVGFWGLWRAARRSRVDGRTLGAGLLAGFGLWHVLDAVLSHWVLGIHRIKLDSDDPLLWDLAWPAAFGLVPLALAAFLGRRPGSGLGPRATTLSVLAVGLLAAGAGGWALQPPKDASFTTVVFRSEMADGGAMAVLADAGARVLWLDATGRVAVAELPDAGWRLYGRGALLVSGAGGPAGCAGWSRT
ncbi:DUF2243 domain-containing protein [Phenylobacterium sp.]|uniref:DUF2243 domain-containing protein n=1 Tax=Phenylobacterium sp. TaxID=1871053 RepID=UPI002811EB58|nr:DUF2243 domain-containing protein [Phenylobacterium sp.]